MTPEDEEFERIAMEAKLKQDHVRALSLDTYLKTVEELTVARMLVRELGDRLSKLERPWVGLTDEDRYEFAAAQHDWEELLIAAESKLKEKNT
jgi:hypothetical protein